MSDTEKSASSNNKFLKGTLILTVSSIVVKVIGSLNWIILSRVLGGEGIGLYQMGFPIYLMAICRRNSCWRVKRTILLFINR